MGEGATTTWPHRRPREQCRRHGLRSDVVAGHFRGAIDHVLTSTQGDDARDPMRSAPACSMARAALSVNIGPGWSSAGKPPRPQYAAAKYGVIGLSKSYALAFAPRLRQYARAGVYRDGAASKPGGLEGRKEGADLKQTPCAASRSRRCVGPIVFLACDDSRHLTGVFLLCDGGLTMIGA